MMAVRWPLFTATRPRRSSASWALMLRRQPTGGAHNPWRWHYSAAHRSDRQGDASAGKPWTTGEEYCGGQRLDSKVTLNNGTELPKGTMLLGKVRTDDMQQQGMSKLALRFDQPRLKD